MLERLDPAKSKVVLFGNSYTIRPSHWITGRAEPFGPPISPGTKDKA